MITFEHQVGNSLATLCRELERCVISYIYKLFYQKLLFLKIKTHSGLHSTSKHLSNRIGGVMVSVLASSSDRVKLETMVFVASPLTQQN
jgi:hypothetical protein